MSRIALGATAGWFASLAVDFIGHGVALSRYWESTAAYWRPPAELFHLIPIGYAAIAIYCGGLSWLLKRLYPGAGAVTGMRLGALTGLIFYASSTLGTFSVFRMPLSGVVLWTLLGGAESTTAGAAIGWVQGSARPVRCTLCVLAAALVVIALGIVTQNVLR